MGVEKNIAASMIESNPYRYFDEEKGQWVWKVDIDSDYMPRTPEPIVRIGLCDEKYSICSKLNDNAITWEDTRVYKKRLYCEYCGCISEKEHGTCEHCGAPLKEME